MKLSEMSLEQLLAMKAKAEEWIEKKKEEARVEKDGITIKLTKYEYEVLCLTMFIPLLSFQENCDDYDTLFDNYKEAVNPNFKIDADIAYQILQKLLCVSDNPISRDELKNL